MTTPYASEAFLHQILSKAIAAQASDVHLKVGKPPGARVRGNLVYFRVDNIKPEDTEAAASLLLGEKVARGGLGARHEVTGSCAVPGVARFRVTAYRQRGAIAIVMRCVAFAVPALADLGVPAAASGMIEQESGLVLVAGARSSGKTSTIAAMIGHINERSHRHIVTIEDPIEFVHEDKTASVSQRQVGVDTPSIEAGLAASSSLDADVVAASEIASEEALHLALSSAETGRLVIAAVSAPDAVRAIERLIAMSSRPAEVRERLALSLQGVVAQRLLPKVDGSGSVLAAEVLVVTAPVREAIRRLHGASAGVKVADEGGAEPIAGPSLRTLMEKGATTYGSQTFEMHVRALAAAGLISKEILAAL